VSREARFVHEIQIRVRQIQSLLEFVVQFNVTLVGSRVRDRKGRVESGEERRGFGYSRAYFFQAKEQDICPRSLIDVPASPMRKRSGVHIDTKNIVRLDIAAFQRLGVVMMLQEKFNELVDEALVGQQSAWPTSFHFTA
jgi:hypothetical protein